MRTLTTALVILVLGPGTASLAQEQPEAPQPSMRFGLTVADDAAAPEAHAFGLDFTPQEAPAPPRRRIGIKMGAVEAPLAAHLGVEPGEVVLILEVIEGSAAEKAGLERYDVVTHVDGKSPVSNATLIATVQAKKPGETLDLRILRQARAREIAVETEPITTVKTVTTDASGTFILSGIYPGHFTTTLTRDGTMLYVTPSVNQHGRYDFSWSERLQPQQILDRLAQLETRLARMEKLLEEIKQR